ncbi:MAG: hypothetical protein IPK82_11730 [Polyangiaceae bacterium]|nr:hypothetical protein [Polyangiaceae bacterium]
MRSDDPPVDRKALKSAPPPAKEPEKSRTEETRSTGWDLRKQAESAPEPQAAAKGLSPVMVVVLILVAFVLGGAIAAYVAKTYMIKGGQLPNRATPNECTHFVSVHNVSTRALAHTAPATCTHFVSVHNVSTRALLS